jgi:NTP pyrophosphatase (non-canonical NTP hydrolase)
MEFSEYQRKARKTAIYPKKHRIFYPALGLSAEIGELNNKIKKKMRDNAVLDKEDMEGEIGDILWYVAAVSGDLGLSLDKIAQKNLAKLESRMKRGKIKGSGDNR